MTRSCALGMRKPGQSMEELARMIDQWHLPRYAELPNLELYMDQLLGVIEESVGPLIPEGEKVITQSMVNNYVKQGVVPQPADKRYRRSHVAYLIIVCLLKQVFSMAQITQLVNDQIRDLPVERAYDFFCVAFEESMRVQFCGQTDVDELADIPLVRSDQSSFSLQIADDSALTPQRRLAVVVATAVAGKLFVACALDADEAADGEGIG